MPSGPGLKTIKQPKNEQPKEWKANTGKVALLVRSVSTLMLARKISKSVSKLDKEISKGKLDAEDKEAKWEQLHRQNAKLTYQHIMKHRGFLTKIGQAASVKAGDLPAPWVEELKGLQDELPVSSYRDIRRTIRADLGRTIEQVFEYFAEQPIASASVAQAHVARLSGSKRKVCVKVQHKGVASMMGTDLATIEMICSRMAKYHPEAPDATDLIREWRRAAREEVDFRLEAKNAQQALAALRKARLNVTCPEPVPSCCGRRVLTMAFIEGWKITDLDRLPFGTNREELVGPLVDAFAMLAFEEGLIHGDPHPGNVFVEPLDSGPSKLVKVRAALLDWGIVQRMNEEERAAAARWVVAALAQDRIMYLTSLMQLGFVFDVDLDSPEFSSFLEASMGSSAWMFRDSISSSSQQHFLEKLRDHQENAERQGRRIAANKPPPQSKAGEKLVSRIPGIVLFFLRGLEMLQNICGSLDVALSFATIILRRALPLVQSGSRSIARALPAPNGCSELEQAVRLQLQELDEAGAILGAQVAVLSCGTADTPGNWLCRAAVGRSAAVGGFAVTQSTLFPLLDAGVGVLLMCLLAAISRPTVTGKQVTRDTPVAQLWQDFGQRDKGRITIGEVLQHRAGMLRPFPEDLTLKSFCSEGRMEQVLAGALLPCTGDGPSYVLGSMAAALLRRALGKRTAAEALQVAMQNLGLEEHITYRGPDQRMALAGKKPRESLTMEKIWEFLEEKQDLVEAQAQSKKRALWLTWRELASEKPGFTDPLLVNKDLVRTGTGSLPGRGLRASAEALCQLYASELVPAEVLMQSQESARQLIVDSVEEWKDLGSSLDIAVGGWQRFRFRRLDGSGEVIGFGYADGATGSISLRLPTASVAVLLNFADKETRHAGHSLLRAAVGQLGLEPVIEVPNLPEKAACVALQIETYKPNQQQASCESGLPAEAQQTKDEKIMRLQEVLKVVLPDIKLEDLDLGLDGSCGPVPDLQGTWRSAETDGINALLEAFDVPPTVRTMFPFARRTMSIKLDGDHVTIRTTTSVMGSQIEDTQVDFTVGTEFQGKQELGGSYRGSAVWLMGDGCSVDEPCKKGSGSKAEEADDTTLSTPRHRLALQKRFELDDRVFIIEECYALREDGRLELALTIRTGGLLTVKLEQVEEQQQIHMSLDPETLQLRNSVQVSDGLLQKGGRFVGTSEQEASLEWLSSVTLPAKMTFEYDDPRCTIMFDREGGNVPLNRPKLKDVLAARGLGNSDSLAIPGTNSVGRGSASSVTMNNLGDRVFAPPGSMLSDCMAVTGLTASALFSMGFSAAARAADAICREGRNGSRSGALEGIGLLQLGETSMEAAEEAETERMSEVAVALAEQPWRHAPQPAPPVEEYAITLEVDVDMPLGISMDPAPTGEDGQAAIVFVSSTRANAMQQWNILAAPGGQVQVGERIVEVNGIRGDATVLMRESEMIDGGCSRRRCLELRLQRSCVWRCCWDAGIRVRVAPRIDSGLTGETVAHNELFLVSQEYLGPDGILYLRLANGRGWLFDARPNFGEVCVRHDAATLDGVDESLTLCDATGGQSADRLSDTFQLEDDANQQEQNAALTQKEHHKVHQQHECTPQRCSLAQDFPVETEDTVALTQQQRQLRADSLRIEASTPQRPPPEIESAFTSPQRRIRRGGLQVEASPPGTAKPLRDFQQAPQLQQVQVPCGPSSPSRHLPPPARGPPAGAHLEPRPSVVRFQDPRSDSSDAAKQPSVIGVIGFCYSGNAALESACDGLCRAEFLSNLYDVGYSGGFHLQAPCKPDRLQPFRNAEAAFHALKFWHLADEFANLSGPAALMKKKRLAGHEDLSFAGHGSNWQAMLAVLRSKFAPGSHWASGLLQTADAFLLKHGCLGARDDIWSDDGTGEGRNWLGMQLMLVRDELSGGKGLWTQYITSLINIATGKAYTAEAAAHWQKAVRGAATALEVAATAQLSVLE